jgi:hypothetical protein
MANSYNIPKFFLPYTGTFCFNNKLFASTKFFITESYDEYWFFLLSLHGHWAVLYLLDAYFQLADSFAVAQPQSVDSRIFNIKVGSYFFFRF